jgi:hypothetical protein
VIIPQDGVLKNSLRRGRVTMRAGVIILIAGVALLAIPGTRAVAETLSEPAKAALEKRFTEMDTNGDGKIDRTEYVDYEIKKANERFDFADRNGDGYITRKEAQKAAKKRQVEMREKMWELRQKQAVE